MRKTLIILLFLLLVNEQLEAEVARLYAAVSRNGSFERGGGALH